MNKKIGELRSRKGGWPQHQQPQTPPAVETPVQVPTRLTQPARSDSPSAKRLRRARAAHRGYFRWLRLSRLAQAAFIVFAAFFFLWALPWLPKGLDTDDYTPELALTVYLVVGVAAAAIFASVFQELARRHRERLVLLGEFFDETTGLHSRTYLNDRIALECERAKRGGAVFSLLVLKFHFGGSVARRTSALSRAALQDLAQLIDSRTHPSDLVARLSGAELAVLATGVDRAGRKVLVDRLRGELEAALPRLLSDSATAGVQWGAATFGEDGTSPDALVQTARTDSILAVRRRGEAA